MRTSKSFARGGPKYKSEPTVLVVCEDSKAGKTYIEDAALYYRVNVVIKVVHINNTDPLGIVKEGIAQCRSYERIFCVIDRDTHENFDEAIQLAKKYEQLVVIASYPCSEFWYLIHYCRSRKSYAHAGRKSPGKQQLDALLGHYPNYEKSATGLFKELLDKLPTAKQNAEWALQEAAIDGNLNPSTKIHELIAFIEGLKDVRPL